MNTELLDVILTGRIDPFIYAFKTSTIPNYLKIGDTYRGVDVRLDEWRKIYPHLKKVFEAKALVNKNIFFRDFSVHRYLETDKGLHRLSQSEINDDVFYSKEFFENATINDISDAIKDIKGNYGRTNKYDYYETSSLTQEEFQFEREKYPRIPRDNQKEAIKNFKKAVDNGKTKLLLYAVMRFGKTFTSLCCAKEINANFVLVVSAKADVSNEWKRDVEQCKNFEEYIFLDSDKLKNNPNVINECLNNKQKIVVFLTLQDLQGNTIKKKHSQVFKNKIDLLIVDETHFGARAQEYGKVLRDRDEDFHFLDEIEHFSKILPCKIQLHLSGTPYRILFSNEFSTDEIIYKCQYSDIISAKEEWDYNNLSDDSKNEWDNPYFGFPEMIRFAFKINDKSIQKLNKLRNNGLNIGFSDLFKSRNGKFIFEDEVLDFLKIIDGTKREENILSFLNYDKIKKGMLCRHMVMVLPYKESCDAMEKIINSYRFKNLNDYEILNISGVIGEKRYHSIDDVKNIISNCDLNNKKTLTLTVNKMLTGTTVPEWDTMIFLKGTSSPQEYDQAIFRLQNPFIDVLTDNNGGKIKYNKKPQTLLVDFNLYRMFKLEEEKCFVGNLTNSKAGNKQLEEKLKKELLVSPIITANKDKITRVEANDIIKMIGDYANSKGVLDEVFEIPVDLKLLNNQEILNTILSQNEINSKNVLKMNSIDNTDGKELNIDELLNDNVMGDIDVNDVSNEESNDSSQDEKNDKNTIVNSLINKFRTYYSRILFFSFLTDNNVQSLDEIIDVIDIPENKRIANNLELDKNTLELISKEIYRPFLSKLDYKIGRINYLSTNEDYEPIKRARLALNKFTKLADSEIITPYETCYEVVNLIPNNEYEEIVKKNGKILDISSTMGEFTIALYNKMVYDIKCNPDDIKNLLYAIPSSKIAYEFTRKIYNILGLNVNCISSEIISYDLIDNHSIDEIFDKKEGEKMKFDAIVGNPPYQLKGGSGGNNDAPIYQYFVDYAEKLDPTYYSLITKAAWFSAGRENLLDDFRTKMLNNEKIQKMIVYPKATDVFPGGASGVEIKGGVCYLLYNKNYTGKCEYSLINNNKKITVMRKLNSMDIFIRDPMLSQIVEKVLENKDEFDKTLEKVISADTPFNIPSNPKTSKKTPVKVYKTKENDNCVMLYHIENQKRKIEYVDKKYIKKNLDEIGRYKVFVPESGGSGNDKMVIGKPVVAPRESVCSQSFLFAGFDSEAEAINFEKYLKTKFLRALVASIKITQTATNKVYKFVPNLDYKTNRDIKWNCSIEEIDKQLFKKFKLSEEEINYINENFDYMD